MIRLIIVALTLVLFLILSIPVLIVEWIIGKFNPRARDISSLRIIQGVFKLIFWETGSHRREHTEGRNGPLCGKSQELF